MICHDNVTVCSGQGFKPQFWQWTLGHGWHQHVEFECPKRRVHCVIPEGRCEAGGRLEISGPGVLLVAVD